MSHLVECFSSPCYLFPPGVPWSSRAQHGHCRLCRASPHSWCAAAVLLPLSDALCALWDRDRKAKSEWAGEKDPIVEQRKTKYNSGRERQGESTKIEIGGSTEGVVGFTLTRRHLLGLFFNIMHRRVRTYNHIKMKRYRYSFSRYIYQFVSCSLSVFINTTLALISPCFLLTLNQTVHSNKLQVCPGGVKFTWFAWLMWEWMLLRNREVWSEIVRRLICKFTFWGSLVCTD